MAGRGLHGYQRQGGDKVSGQVFLSKGGGGILTETWLCAKRFELDMGRLLHLWTATNKCRESKEMFKRNTLKHKNTTINKSFIRYAYFNFLFWKKWLQICMVCLTLRTYSNVCF